MNTTGIQAVLAAVACVVSCGIRAETPDLTVAVISDVHLRVDDKARYFEKRFRKALKFFDAKKVDAVLGCGDWIELGWYDWFRRVGECWFDTFPGNRRSDGEPIEKLFVYGDHEIENFWNPNITRTFSREYIAERDIPLYGRGKIYEETLKEPWAPIMRKRVKGYDFVLAHFTMKETPDHWGGNIPGLAEFFATNKFDTTRPFFYAQHKPPKNTVISPLVTTSGDGSTTKVLRDYPNCVAFCGHKHRSAISERNLWQGEFTCLETPAMQNNFTDAGHENGWCSCDGYATRPPPQMRSIAADMRKDGGECYIMKVYAKRIVIERWNVILEEKFADDWVIPWPQKGEMSFEARKARSKPVAFAPGAKVTAVRRTGTDRRGNTNGQYVVTFPRPVSDATHARGYDYRVTAEVTKHFWKRIASEKWVYSAKYYLPERLDTNEVTCVFSVAEIPGPFQEVDFRITPYNAFGVPGEPISSGPLAYRDIEFIDKR